MMLRNNDSVHSIINGCLEENADSLQQGLKSFRAINHLLECHRLTIEDLKSFFDFPDESLGPFDKLSEKLRHGLSAAAAFHIQQTNLLTNKLVRFLSYGPIVRFGGYLVHIGWKQKSGLSDPKDPIASKAGRKIIRFFRLISSQYIHWIRFTRLNRAPFIHTLWSKADIDPWPLIHNYIKKIPVDATLSPVFSCAERNVTGCGLIGIDLLQSNGKIYFLESNFNPGHNFNRHLLFPEGDILAHHIFDWAAKNGYRKIIFYPFNFPAIFEERLETVWREIGLVKGVQLEVKDYPIYGSPAQRDRSELIDLKCSDTLVINGRHLVGPFPRLISDKGLLDTLIRNFNQSTPGRDAIPIPRMIRADEDVPPFEESSIFPNLIVKNSRMDQSKGIRIYKSKILPEDANSWPNITYEYIKPDILIKENNGTAEKYVFLFRAYLLVTPGGPVYLGIRKNVSSRPVPNALPCGKVEDKSPYIANLYSGAYYVPHSEHEYQLCRDAVYAIGKVIQNYLNEKHILTVN